MTDMASPPSRPTLDQHVPDADSPIDQLIDALQGGFDTGDADQYDSMFADDVLWGTLKGQWVAGYGTLNSIHRGLMGMRPVEPASQFELAQAICPAPDVVVAQIRRTALNGGFSEVAMYVLIRHDGSWWLSAAQNTPVTETLPSVDPS